MIPQRYIEEWKTQAPWPINPILKQIRERLSFLGTKRTVKQHIHNNTRLNGHF